MGLVVEAVVVELRMVLEAVRLIGDEVEDRLCSCFTLAALLLLLLLLLLGLTLLVEGNGWLLVLLSFWKLRLMTGVVSLEELDELDELDFDELELEVCVDVLALLVGVVVLFDDSSLV